MRPLALLLVALSGLAFAPAGATLPQGDGRFQLGMLRSELDSLIAARGQRVISAHQGVIACTSDDPAVEFERYSFVMGSGGPPRLWCVTIAYRASSSADEFASAEQRLRELLGEPVEHSEDRDPETGRLCGRKVAWNDALITVRLGARWTGTPDPAVDRMLVTWTDRRSQRLAEARRKVERKGSR